MLHIIRGLACGALLIGSVLASAEPRTTFYGELSKYGGHAVSDYRHWGAMPGYGEPRERDTVNCMALGCPGSPPAEDYEELPSEDAGHIAELPGHRLPSPEIQRRLKDLDAQPPRPKPATEDDARTEFYRQLHRHADGLGTYEDAKRAHRDLLPFRR